MEEEPEDTPRSPFWVQSTTDLRRRTSSLFFNSLVLIIILLLLAVLSMVFIVPSAIDFSSHFFRPNFVKRSWDSVNLLLVLFALAFGFLSRNVSSDGYDRSPSDLSAGAPVVSPSSSTPRQWYEFPDQPIASTVGLRRQRTSSSYPDLRELSPPWNHADPWRFSDDTHLNYYRGLESSRNYLRQWSRLEQDYESKNTFVGHTPPEQPPALPPQPPATTVKRKTKRMYHNVAPEDGERSGSSSGTKKTLSPVVDPAPEPSSPPAILDIDQKSVRTYRKRNGGNTTKEFFTSFYHKKKKKKQRQKSVENLNSILHHSQPSPVRVTVQLQPSSPPAIPPPPPPPPARRATTRVAPFITDKPPVPLKLLSFNAIDDSSSGGESPMKQIPPPPPLPPFKMPDWKFAVEGDFVRLQSTLSSRSVSPDGEESRSPSSDVDAATAGGGASPLLFFPSPDVDTKADSFIARFRAGLKLEKNSSFNQNQGFRMSKLGPGPGPSDT